jgi:cobalt-zinc-cadmium efflux system outer membrane protein
MMRRGSERRPGRRWRVALLCGLAWLGGETSSGRAGQDPPAQAVPVLPAPQTAPEVAPPAADGTPAPPAPLVLSPGDAVKWAIEHNPELATLRQQHGIAAAGIIIADTYPFNPFVQDFVWASIGHFPDVKNNVFNEHTMRLDLELRGQGTHRRAMARAILSRTDWEIAAQEVLLAVRVVRAFNTLLYRREKLRLLDETVGMQEQATRQVELLVEQGRLPRASLLLARADLAEARTSRGPAQSLVATAWFDLRRALGILQEPFDVKGSLEAALPHPDAPALVEAALERRPDLHAFERAVDEADARMRLEIANRYGNPSLGPAYEYNETAVNFVGMWAFWQLPIINTRRGEIQMRQAEKARAQAAVRQSQVTIEQDVQAAMGRLKEAEGGVQLFRNQTFPALQAAIQGIDRLFAQGAPDVGLDRVLEVRRRLLRARDGYLDALFELNQARADLAAAVGDPSLGFAFPPTPAPPGPATPK